VGLRLNYSRRSRERYNIRVPGSTLQDDHRPAGYASESTGLLLIALLLLILTRYGHDTHWSLR